MRLRPSAALVGLSLSCAQADEGAVERSLRLGRHAQDIVHGSASGTDQNSVVLVVRGSFLDYCTGTVIAPDLVLTARHCLFDALLGEDRYLHCERDGDGAPVLAAYSPQAFGVYVGNAKPLPSQPSGVGTAIYSSEDLNLCDNDVAVLAVDRPLPVDSFSLRLDAPPRVGELGTFVGWGALTEEGPYLPDERQQREVRIDAVGPTLFTPEEGSPREIRETVFAGTEGGCIGDSGGPLISAETGAVLGVMSEIGNPDVSLGLEEQNAISNCTRGISEFQRLDRQQLWLRQVFQDRGLNPWIEGKRQPANAGEDCADGDECRSGLCLSVGEQQLCSQDCSDKPCPADFQCVGPTEQRLCVPNEVRGTEAESSGCTLSQPSRGNTSFSHSPLWALLALSLRQRAHSLSRRK